MNSSSPRMRVLHFVTGGFSGATQVAADLCLAELAGERVEPVLVLRKKRHTDMKRVQALRDRGLAVYLVSGWSHPTTIWALRNLCLTLKPDVIAAHGFPEHLIGRWAGVWAGVKNLVQVEHNTRERYTRFKRWQARKLDAYSAKLVGVSEGVRRRLVALGAPEALTLAIPNGIALERFADPMPFEQREQAIIMSARFARQKDQPTLIRAMALLKERGFTPPLYLAGSGSGRWRGIAERLARQLNLPNVQFLGHVSDMPKRLMSTRIFVLSTHWEGMPLALVEAMAAGCACVASNAPGVEGLLDDGRGLLVRPGDAQAMADALERLLSDPVDAAELGARGRERAMSEHGLALMNARYEELLLALQQQPLV